MASRRRTPVGPRRGRAPIPGSPARTAVAAGIFLTVLGLFGGFGYLAWQSLPELPGREALRNASAEAAAAANVAPAARVRDRFVDRASGNGATGQAAVATEPAPAAAPTAAEQPGSDGPQATRYKLVIIENAGLIDVRSRKLRIAHVDALGAEARCTDAAGNEWPCGARARTALRRLVRARAIDCLDLDNVGPAATAQPPAISSTAAPGPAISPTATGSEPVTAATCEVAAVDLGRWLVEQGWATPGAGAPDEFRSLHADARAAGRGIYAVSGR